MEPDSDEPPKRRGRPPGSRNKAKPGDPDRVDTASFDDYRHADPTTLVARNLLLIDWTQQALRGEMQRRMTQEERFVEPADIKKLVEVSNALSRTVEALKRTSDLAEELSKRMTPEQLMEAALKKVEGQDLPTIRYAIKRLRACLERLTPAEKKPVEAGDTRATDALASLEFE